jgi:hypothetical protein
MAIKEKTLADAFYETLKDVYLQNRPYVSGLTLGNPE